MTRSNANRSQLSTHSKNTSKIRKKKSLSSKSPSSKLSDGLRNSTKRPVMNKKTSDNMKNKEIQQDSTNAVPFPVANISDHNLNQQLSQSNGGALIQLTQPVTRVVCRTNTNKVTHQPANIEKKAMWKMLPHRPSQCLIKDCDYSFHRRSSRKNKKYHANDKKCYCYICSKPCYTYDKLEEHYFTTHHYMFQCASPNCSFMSKTRAQFENHYQQYHPFSDLVNNSNGYSVKSPTDESYFRIVHLWCRMCSEKFNTRAELDQHIATQHINQKPYYCAVEGCSSSFMSCYQLQDHYDNDYHLDQARKKQFRCSHCGRTFEDVSKLVHHLNKIKYYVERGEFACVAPECGFTSQFCSLVIEHYVESHQ